MYFPTEKDFIKKAKEGNLIPVYKEIIADMETPVSSFLKIYKSKYAFLLESVEGGEKIGRYSFLSCNPFFIMKSKGHQIEVEYKNKKRIVEIKTGEDPLTFLENELKKFKFVPVEGLPRFCGGAVGFISYDTVRFFERLPESTMDDLNFPEIEFIFTDSILAFDHLKHKIKIIANVLIEDDPRVCYHQALRRIEILEKKLGKSVKKRNYPLVERMPRKVELKSNFSQADFIEVVKRIKRYIRAGDAIQVVISQRFQTELELEPFDIYRALRSTNPSPYMFFLKYDEIYLIGSSPEILVTLEGRNATTRPLAGTRPRGETEKEDENLARELLADKKERAEHIMLVDLGRNDLGRVCESGTVEVNQLMEIEKYSHVMHMVSNVTGRLRRGKSQFDLMRAVFPAGTVSGAPKIRAMEIIDELEPTRRGPYAGSVGYFSFSGNLDSCITIRTILMRGNKLYIQAGAGIVADSNPKKEYLETKSKAKALVSSIKMAKEGLL